MVRPIGPVGPIGPVRPLDPMRDPWPTLERATPIALLPVRLETRWFAGATANEVELRVRIFPDAIHLANARTASADDALVLPQARALPDRFVALAYEAGTRRATVWGSAVARDVPIVPDDTTPGRWQTDFVAAEAVGLAVRLRFDRSAAQRLTRIAVLGVRGGSGSDGASLLGALLEDHALDRGLALLPSGTPTNHTVEQRATAAAIVPTATPGPGTDGARLATALGTSAEIFRSVGGGDRTTDATARALHRAIWPATWGYFLENIIGAAVRPETRTAGRTLFIDHVRAAGPFPTLCVGRQPYGILPISSLTRWKDPAGAPDPFVGALAALLPRWLASGRAAAQLPAAGDALPQLSAVLSQQARSVRWLAREAATVEIATHWWLDDLLPGFDDIVERALLQKLKQPIIDELTRVGLLPTPDPVGIEPLVHADLAHALALPLVGHAADGTSAPPYLAGLASIADIHSLRAHRIAGASPRSLLYLLLRHATLLVLARSADDLSGVAVSERREADVRTAGATTVWDRLDQPVRAHGGRTARELLTGPSVENLFSELWAHRAALTALGQLSAIELERSTAESLDLTSHRIDAWVTALATRRLYETRTAGTHGLHVGAYAWIDAPPLPATLARDGVVALSTSQGFMLAPSLDHARTAAVLRAGFNARPTSDLAVDLSSQRVQRARWLLAGLRAGRSLAELLGFQIERWLGNAAAIRQLRLQFPLGGPTVGTADPNQARLDGLATYHAWRSATPPAPFAGAAVELLDVVDATADLLLAESVYQHVRGNPDRAGALLEAVAAGTIAPVDPDVVKTPIDSDGTTYQAVWVLDDDAPGWPGDERRVRAVANPPMNASLAAVLGDPRDLRATIRYYRDSANQEISRSIVDLDLCALDLCALAGTAFESSPLRTLLLAEAPADATAVEIVASPRLREAHLLATAFAAAMRNAVPWAASETVTSEATAEWSGAADRGAAVLDALAEGDDHRRVAALLGGPVTDVGSARALLTDHTARIRSRPDPADRVRALSGMVTTLRSAIDATPASDVLATSASRVAWMADAARLRPALAALELVTSARTVPTSIHRRSDGAIAFVLGGAPGATVRALRLDAWTESRPRPELTAGVAFHHDAPRARAPQAILLAVPPDPTQGWSLAALEATLLETIDLLTARLARPHDVWGPLLPALYLAENLDGDTVSTTLTDVMVDVVARE